MERKYFKINRKNKKDNSDINENVMLDALSSAKSIIDGQVKEEIKNINEIRTKDKFKFAQIDETIHDTKFETKPKII